MTDAQKRAHERMMAVLPIKTHSQMASLLEEKRGRKPGSQEAGDPIAHACEVKGRRFNSIRLAARAHKVSHVTLLMWIAKGQMGAKYL